MRTKVLLAAATLLLLSASGAMAGGKHKKYTCDDCSPDCLKSPYGKGCPSICRSPECQEASCDSCSAECKKNPSSVGCPEICKDVKCQSCEDCSAECKTNPANPSCPDICKDIKCYTCDSCTADCIINPSGPGCPTVCADLGCNVCDKFPKDCAAACKDHPDDPAKCAAACKGVPEQCIPKQVTCADCPPSCNDNPEQCPAECKNLNCHPDSASQFRFVGDIGYLKQGNAADYVFGRIGTEWSPFTAGSDFENISFLAMLGIAGQVGGNTVDDALLLDVFAQYNWKAGDVDGWIGLGVGGWITSGDVENDGDVNNDDAGDTDVDVMANVGARVYGDPDAFNASLFLEVRSAVDEFSDFGDFGRFGGGLRLKF